MNPNDISAVLSDLSINLRRQGDLILFNRACEFLVQGEPEDALFLLRNAIPKSSFDRYKALLEDPKVPRLLTEDPTLKELLGALQFKDTISKPSSNQSAQKQGEAQLKLSIAYRLLGEVRRFKNERSGDTPSPSINLEFSPFKHTLGASEPASEPASEFTPLASAHESVEEVAREVTEEVIETLNHQGPLKIKESTLETSVGLLDWDELSQPPQAPRARRDSMSAIDVQRDPSSEPRAQATPPPSSLDSPQVKGRVFNTQSALWKRKGFTPLPVVMESNTEPHIEPHTGPHTGPHTALTPAPSVSSMPSRSPSFSAHQSPQDAGHISDPSQTSSNDLWDLSDEPIVQHSSVDDSTYSQEDVVPISDPPSSSEMDPGVAAQGQPMYDPLQMDLDLPKHGTPLTHIDTPIARRLAMAHHEANAGHQEIPSLSEIQSSMEVTTQRSSPPDHELRVSPSLQEVIAGEASQALSQPMAGAWSGTPAPQPISNSRSLLVLLTVIFLFIGLGVSIAYFLFPFFSHSR
jgi:hypothetical protein